MSTVLLIDDDVTGLVARSAMLKSVGYTVVTASTGAEGIALTEECKPDAVVLDFHLPDMPGEEVLRQVRRIDPTLPVIVLSGVFDLPEELVRDASAVLVKGTGARVLLDALSGFLLQI